MPRSSAFRSFVRRVRAAAVLRRAGRVVRGLPAVAAGAATGGLLLASCAGPAGDVLVVDPPSVVETRVPPSDAPRVALVVRDERSTRGEVRAGGTRETIASGRTARVDLSTGPRARVERDLVLALRAAGVAVDPEADVVLDVALRGFNLDAREFTHDTLDPETGSTLDAARVLLPRDLRTTALTVDLAAVLRRRDQSFGFPLLVERTADGDDRDRAVIGAVVAEATSEAARALAAEAAPLVTAVRRLPMTTEEARDRSAAIAALEAEVALLEEALADARDAVEDDRTALNELRNDLDRERRRLDERQRALDEQAASLARARSELVRERDELGHDRRVAERVLDAAAAEAARVKRERANVVTRLEDERTRRAQLDAEVERLAARAATLDAQEARNERERQRLAAERAVVREQLEDTERRARAAARGVDAANEQASRLRIALERAERERALAAAEADRFAERAAALDARRADLERREGEAAALQARIEAERTGLADDRRDIARRESALEERERAHEASARRLDERQAELARTATALVTWERQLAAREIASAAMPPALATNRPPVIVPVEPAERRTETTRASIRVRRVVVDDAGDVPVDVTCRVNGRVVRPSGAPVFVAGARGGVFRRTLAATVDEAGSGPGDAAAMPAVRDRGPDDAGGRVHDFEVALDPGTNRIEVTARDADGLETTDRFEVEYRRPEQARTWVVSIGIDAYTGVPPLDYAVEDATLVADALRTGLGLEMDRVELVLDEDATLRGLRKLLASDLCRRTRPQDTVIIFFSGHGAPEPDGNADDGTGLSKYLLTVDSEIDYFSATALPMREVETIFNRLPAERVVFIADTCYSGAAGEGARTLARPGVNVRQGRFASTLKRLEGPGRAILSASRANEISRESVSLEHGVYTWHLARGLAGAADADGDRRVTVAELHAWTAAAVAEATGNEQNPDAAISGDAGAIVLSEIR